MEHCSRTEGDAAAARLVRSYRRIITTDVAKARGGTIQEVAGDTVYAEHIEILVDQALDQPSVAEAIDVAPVVAAAGVVTVASTCR